MPHTPGGELAKRMREVEAQNHQGRKIRFKIVEKGGVTLEKMLRRSNPWSSENCGRADCFPCKGGEGGTCWREGVTYTLFCVECGEELAAYFGESGRNGFTRGKERIEKYNAKDASSCILHHASSPGEVGCPLQHESDRGLPRAPVSPDHGEGPESRSPLSRVQS